MPAASPTHIHRERHGRERDARRQRRADDRAGGEDDSRIGAGQRLRRGEPQHIGRARARRWLSRTAAVTSYPASAFPPGRRPGAGRALLIIAGHYEDARRTRSTDANGRAPCERRTLDSTPAAAYIEGRPDHAYSRYKRPAPPGVQAMAIDDRPTIAAPDDDPYLWLEEIEGERALAFVDQQSRLTLQKLSATPAFASGSRYAGGDLRPTATTFPMSRRRGGLRLQSLEGCEQSARPLAAHDARGVSQGRARRGRRCWTSTSLAAEEDEDWLLSWTQPLPGSSRAIVAPVARRQRRRHAAGIRSRHQGFRRRRLHAAGSQERRRMDRRRHAAALERPWRGHGDDVRLRQNRPAVAARRADVRTRAGAVRECRPTAWPRTAASIDTGPTPRMWFIERIDFFNLQSLARRPRPVRAQSSTCRPTSGWKRIATGWP